MIEIATFVLGILGSFISSIMLIPQVVKSCKADYNLLDISYLFMRLVNCLLNLVYGGLLLFVVDWYYALPLITSEIFLFMSTFVLIYLYFIKPKHKESIKYSIIPDRVDTIITHEQDELIITIQ